MWHVGASSYSVLFNMSIISRTNWILVLRIQMKRSIFDITIFINIITLRNPTIFLLSYLGIKKFTNGWQASIQMQEI